MIHEPLANRKFLNYALHTTPSFSTFCFSLNGNGNIYPPQRNYYYRGYILRTPMNLRLTQTIWLLLILSSCKSLQRLSSRNNASSTTVSNTRTPNNVTIGSFPVGPDNGDNKPFEDSKKSFTGNASSSFNLEKADWLQIKYAIMMDMPVEQLNNLPLLQQIDHWWGTHYCYGGHDENCIDCSAFTQTMLHTVYGLDVPRTAKEQFNFTKRIDDVELREGDLVFFKKSRTISHVGLYIGNYKFVHAASSEGVSISDLNDSYWSKKYAGAGRVVR